MSNRPARAEADLLESELSAMIDSYSKWNVSLDVGHRYNDIVHRISALLQDDLSHLELNDTDKVDENIYGAGMPSWNYRMNSFTSKAKATLSYMRRASSRRSPVLDARYEVLATLVNAYLHDPSEFEVFWALGEPNPRIAHPGLDGDYQPAWSHVQALSNEGHLDLRQDDGGVELINIPTHVLDAFTRGDPFAVNLPPGPERIHALMESPATGVIMHVHGGNVNFAHASRDFAQTINSGVGPGDRRSLRSALEGLGLASEDISELSSALDEDEAEEGRPSFGDKAQLWIGRFSARATEGVAVGTLVELVKAYVG